MSLRPYLLASLVVMGCVSLSGNFGSDGQLGHAQFAYGCPSGGNCGVDDNVLAAGGAEATVVVTMKDGLGYVAIMSTNPDVATVAKQEGDQEDNVTVTTGHAGQTDLVLLDGQNAVVDRATLTVASTATLDVSHGWSGPRVRILEGTSHEVHAATRDAAGELTLGQNAVRFVGSGGITTEPVTIQYGSNANVVGSTVGPGQLVAMADQVTATIDLDVVPATAITSVDVKNLGTSDNGSGDVEETFQLVLQSADGPIYGGGCSWTVSDPSSVSLVGELQAGLDQAPSTSVIFGLSQPGEFAALCSYGGRTVRLTLTN